MGTEGFIRLHSPWWRGTAMTLHKSGREERFELPHQGNGYTHEAAEVGRCLRQGLAESPVMPLEETLAVMRTLDRIRAAWGLRYPME
jgi:predicted dehydrogenase